MPQDDLTPHQRRTDDIPFPSGELILYQIGELKVAIKELGAELKGRQDRTEDRVTSLERFRERVEERDRADASSSQTVNARWIPILIVAATILVTVILFLVGGR